MPSRLLRSAPYFPVADVANQSNPLPVCITPPITDALDYLTTLLRPFGIPADALMPFALVFELNAVGAITAEDLYVDRLIGAGLSDFEPAGASGEDFFAGAETRALKHETAMDRLAEKFGKGTLVTGRALKTAKD